jgi:hypothetical protein
MQVPRLLKRLTMRLNDLHAYHPCETFLPAAELEESVVPPPYASTAGFWRQRVGPSCEEQRFPQMGVSSVYCDTLDFMQHDT